MTMKQLQEVCILAVETLELFTAITLLAMNLTNNTTPYTYICKGTYLLQNR